MRLFKRKEKSSSNVDSKVTSDMVIDEIKKLMIKTGFCTADQLKVAEQNIQKNESEVISNGKND